MKINELIKQSYALAKEKGWHEQERSPFEYYALIIREVSEATEEARTENPPIWHRPADNNGIYKPEGELIELADAVIRIADYAGSREWDLEDEFIEITSIEELQKISLNVLIEDHPEYKPEMNPLEVHFLIVKELCDTSIGEQVRLVNALTIIAGYCELRGWDLTEAISLKHEYNKTRPYRHGGKLY